MELCSDEDVEKALGHNHENMGRRYVEIFRALRSQMEWDLRKDNKTEGTGVVRLRGLPYGCVIEQINTFFSGLEVVSLAYLYITNLYQFLLRFLLDE